MIRWSTAEKAAETSHRSHRPIGSLWDYLFRVCYYVLFCKCREKERKWERERGKINYFYCNKNEDVYCCLWPQGSSNKTRRAWNWPTFLPINLHRNHTVDFHWLLTDSKATKSPGGRPENLKTHIKTPKHYLTARPKQTVRIKDNEIGNQRVCLFINEGFRGGKPHHSTEQRETHNFPFFTEQVTGSSLERKEMARPCL